VRAGSVSDGFIRAVAHASGSAWAIAHASGSDRTPQPAGDVPVPDTWTVAGVQTDCALADRPANLRAMAARLAAAADRGARLVVFPECALTGYGFDSRAAVRAAAETVPGPCTDAVAREC